MIMLQAIYSTVKPGNLYIAEHNIFIPVVFSMPLLSLNTVRNRASTAATECHLTI